MLSVAAARSEDGVEPEAAKAKEGGSGDICGDEELGGETVVRICRVGAAVRSLVLPDGTDVVLGSDETLPYLVGGSFRCEERERERENLLALQQMTTQKKKVNKRRRRKLTLNGGGKTFFSLPKQDGSLPYFGVVVGRVANRISGASFSLPDGTRVKLPANDNGRHCLHGGVVGWDKREWSVVEEEGTSSSPSSSSGGRSSALLSLLSEDGDQGFPGNVRAKVLYELLPGGKTLR